LGKNKRPADLEWNWQRVMDWYATEGGYHKRDKRIEIAQSDRKPLDDICNFLMRQGIKVCTVRRVVKGYRLDIGRSDDVRLFMQKGEPFAPTEKVCKGFEELEGLLAEVKPRKVYRPRRKRVRFTMTYSNF